MAVDEDDGENVEEDVAAAAAKAADEESGCSVELEEVPPPRPCGGPVGDMEEEEVDEEVLDSCIFIEVPERLGCLLVVPSVGR